MIEPSDHLTKERLRSPRAMAIAGLVFSLLLGAIILSIQRSLPPDPSDISGQWLDKNTNMVSLAIGSVSIVGVVFLWFMGVVRDRLGHIKDQFFSTVHTGSGLLLLAMLFIWAALGGALLDGYSANPELMVEGGFYLMGRNLMRECITFAMSMAGVYIFSSGMSWARMGTAPRWLSIVTWSVALLLWSSSYLGWWVQLMFPAWVFLLSVYLLFSVSQQAKSAD